MNLGNKILELRKSQKMSQEQLAEKMEVTRQTISNWELNETAPDINQAKQLSKIFNVSLDELTDNNIKDILVEKISNTEKLAGVVLKIIKVVGIAFAIMLVVDIIAFIVFSISTISKNNSSVEVEATLSCALNNEYYNYSIKYDDENNIIEAGGDGYIEDVINTESYSDAIELINDIETYFENKGGSCD